MFNEGDIIYNKSRQARCLVRWARDDRFGWTYEKYSHISRDTDVQDQGDLNFELIQAKKNQRVKRERKTERVRRIKRVRRVREVKKEKIGGFFE
jgi:hypothetical protein